MFKKTKTQGQQENNNNNDNNNNIAGDTGYGCSDNFKSLYCIFLESKTNPPPIPLRHKKSIMVPAKIFWGVSLLPLAGVHW